MSSANPDRALRQILPAMVLASGLGYAVQLCAPVILGASSYVEFSSFWSALFLCVAALSGVQNEIARSATLSHSERSGRIIRDYSLIVGGGVIVVSAVGGAVFAAAFVREDQLGAVIALGLGLVSYALLAIVSGVLYGARRWTGVVAAIIVDPAMRAVFFGALAVVALLGSKHAVPLTVALFAAAIPFAFAAVALWARWGSRALGVTTFDTDAAGLVRNSFHAVVASTSLGFVAAGMPLLVAALGRDESPALVAGTVLVVVLVRAPIVSPMIALQSFLTVSFRDSPASSRRRATLVICGLASATVLIATGVALFGDRVVSSLLPSYTLPPTWLIVVIVVAAGLVGVQVVAGALVLARAAHRLYAAGWATTAVGVVLFCVLPLAFAPKLAIIMTAPGMLGVAVHLIGSRVTGGAGTRHV